MKDLELRGRIEVSIVQCVLSGSNEQIPIKKNTVYLVGNSLNIS